MLRFSTSIQEIDVSRIIPVSFPGLLPHSKYLTKVNHLAEIPHSDGII
jgi:hypothetical protein